MIFTHHLEVGDEIALTIGDEDVVPVVRLQVNCDKDGDMFVELVPENCNLEGQEPCLYYPTPITEDQS